MNKLLIVPILATSLLISQYSGSTTGVVTIVGAYIKAHDHPINQKYKRKDCPVCKGTGKYLSGDGIKMVDCGYCEPEKNDDVPQEKLIDSVIDEIKKENKQYLTDTVILYVTLPNENTQVQINGYDMKKGFGRERMYVSNGLKKDHVYDYSVRIFYNENSKDLQQVRILRVVGGEKRHINFNE